VDLGASLPGKVEDIADCLQTIVRAAKEHDLDRDVCQAFLKHPDTVAKLVGLAVDPYQEVLINAAARAAANFLGNDTPANEHLLNMALARLRWSVSGDGGTLPIPNHS
jgi:hypothetical protein